MTIIQCKDEKYALNLNTYKIYVLENEKTKLYLEYIKKLQDRQRTHFEVVVLPFDASEAYDEVDESVDPQLYQVLTHADMIARVMPWQNGDYRYQTQALIRRREPDFDYMYFKWGEFVSSLERAKEQSFVNCIRRFFQHGNEEFADFVMEVYEGNLKELLDMSKRYSRMMCTNDFRNAQNFTRQFLRKLNDEQREQLDTIIKDALDYNSPAESKAVLADFLYADFQTGYEPASPIVAKREKIIRKPDFKIVVTPRERKRLTDAEGDYDILIVKDSGATIPLEFGYRGDKIFYLLTLLCQKKKGGLPTKYFTLNEAKRGIKGVYNEVFRSGGDEWVEAIAQNTHRLSVSRTHAKLAIESNHDIDLNTAYWCNLETTSLYVGPKQKKLNVRRVRLPEERIDICDANRLMEWLENMPSFEQIVGYVAPNAEKVMGVKVPRFGRQDPTESLFEE